MEESLKKGKLNKIKVFNGDRTKLVEEFNTTFYKVRRSLDGEINTDLSFQIRESAIKLGGEMISDEARENTRRIKVFDGDRKFLKKKFNTTYFTVGKALAGESSTLLGYQIRESAIKDCGGREIVSQESNEIKTKIN